MVKIEKNIAISGSLLIVSVVISVFSLLSKGKSVPSVSIIVDGVTGMIIKQPGNAENDFWNNYPAFTMQAEGQKLDPSIVIYDKDLQQHKLGSLLQNKHTIVFKYSIESSGKEVDSTLTILQRISRQNLVVLIDGDNMRYFRLKNMQDSSLSSISYFLEKPSLDLLIEKSSLPFLFVCSPDMRVSDVFVPRKEIPQVTQKYLEYMQKVTTDQTNP